MVSSEEIVSFAASISADELSETVVDDAGRVLLDTIGCAIGAVNAPPVLALRSIYGNYRCDEKMVTIIGSGERLPLEYAALINGTMVRYLDFNDGYRGPHGGCHPSDLIPAVLATAEAVEANGRDLLEALVVAYEIQCAGVSTGAVRTGGWDYVTWGTHAATAAVGTLMGLSDVELIDALGMAVAANNAFEITRFGLVSQWKGVAH